LEESADLRPLWRAWRAGDPELAEARALMPSLRSAGPAVPRLVRLKQSLAQARLPVADRALERVLIVSAAAPATARADGLPVDESVKQLILQNFDLYAAARVTEPFDLSRGSFEAMGRIATLSRFPAGQLDWVVSGVPRSWLFGARWHAAPRLVRALLFDLR